MMSLLSLYREMAGLGLDRDPTQFGEAVDAGLAAEATVTGSLGAAERHLCLVMHGRAVDVADARSDLACDAQAARGVASEDSGGQAVFGVVRQFDRMRLVARADQPDNGAEALLAEQRHCRCHPVDDMRGHQDAIGVAADQQFRTRCNRVVDQPHYVVDRLLVDHRAERCRALARIADGHRFDLRLEPRGEIVGDRVDNDDPFGRHADLARIHECTEGRGLDRFVQIGVVEDDQWRLAPEFEQHRLQLCGRARCDDPPDRGRSGEVDTPHRRMIDHRPDDLAGVGGGVGDQVDDALAKPRDDEGGNDQRVGAGTLFRCLQDHGVAACQRHRDRAHAQNDRRVPRRDAQDNPGGFAQRHRDASRLVGRNDLAADLGRHRGGFTHDPCRQHQVERGPALRGTNFRHHRCDEIIAPGFERIGRFHQHRAARIGAHRGPGGGGIGGGIGGGGGVGNAGGIGGGRKRTCHGVAAIEASRRLVIDTPDRKINAVRHVSSCDS